jgi:hypothetical protein
MNDRIWTAFQNDREDVAPDEMDWRPVPEANSINLIVRHLLIEAAWHVARLEERDESGHGVGVHEVPRPLDSRATCVSWAPFHGRFTSLLRGMTMGDPENRSSRA